MWVLLFFIMITLYTIGILLFTNDLFCIVQDKKTTLERWIFIGKGLMLLAMISRVFFYANNLAGSQGYTVQHPALFIANLLMIVGVLASRKGSKLKIIEDIRQDTKCLIRALKSFYVVIAFWR